jgi:hypothetical protein
LLDSTSARSIDLVTAWSIELRCAVFVFAGFVVS